MDNNNTNNTNNTNNKTLDNNEIDWVLVESYILFILAFIIPAIPTLLVLVTDLIVDILY